MKIFPFCRAEEEEELKKQQEQLLQQQQQKQQQKQVKQPLPIQQEKSIDPAIEAEMKAKQERDRIPLEQRLKEFRQLLEDKKVSATNIWEKELSKVCNCTCTIIIYISLK
jgi:transcription elongation regulator 1